MQRDDTGLSPAADARPEADAGPAAEGRPAADERPAPDAPAPRPVSAFPPLLLALVGLLSAITALVHFSPVYLFVVIAPQTDHVINTAATLAAAGVAILAWIRFRETSQLDNLLQSSAFLVLFAGNAIALLLVVGGQDETLGFDRSMPGQAPVYLWTAQRLLAASLLLAAAFTAIATRNRPSASDDASGGASRGRLPALTVLGPTAVLLLAGAAILVGRDSLPALIPSSILAFVTQPVDRVDPTQISQSMLVSQLAIAVLFAAAGLGYGWAYHRSRIRKPSYAYLSAGLIVAAFSQVHFTVVPGAYGGLVSSGDLLRIGFYAVVGLGVAAAARQDLRELRQANLTLHRLRAADNERISLEERARLARDVHDGLVQHLWLARLTHGQLSQALEQTPDLAPDARQTAERVDSILEDALAEARQAVVSLQPADDATFGSLLRRSVEDYADRYGLEIECSVDGKPVILSGQVQAEVLRICREAINNTRKHADASLVRVRLDSDGDIVRLTIADNGRGFESSKPQRQGYGIRGMHQRAAGMGGRLRVDSEPMNGTRVTLELPHSGPGGLP